MHMSKQNTLLEINPKAITIREGFNTRYDLGDLRELTASMANGFDKAFPLIVSEDPNNEGKYILGSQGHRRLNVALELSLKTVYAVLEPENLSDEDRNLDIARLNNGEPLSMLAFARVIERAWGDGEQYTKRDLGKLVGKTDTFIGDCLKLVAQTKTVLKYVEKDKISAQNVVELVNELKDPEKVEAAVEKWIAKAAESGKNKASKKYKPVEAEESEEAKQEAAEEKAHLKAVNKDLQDTKKRVVKFQTDVAEFQVALEARDKKEVTAFEKAMADFIVILGGHLSGDETVTGGKMNLSDAWINYKKVLKTHNETVKENVKEVKEAAKEEVKAVKTEAKEAVTAVKDQLKETKEQAAQRIKDAKEKAANKS